MKIVSPYALLVASLIPLAPQACAQPLELSGCDPATAANQDCDVIFANPSDFAPDASAGAQGNVGGSGNLPQGGTGGTNPSQGGSPSLGGSSNPGTGGTGQGGTAPGTGGTAITTGGTAGSAGSAGTAGTGGTDTGGTGGTGGVVPVFDSASCDFDDATGCEAFGCQNCGQFDTNCAERCPEVVQCARDNVTCLSAADPLCGRRDGAVTQACTELVESSGGLNPQPNQPTSFARPLVECLCSTPRPGQ